MNALARFPLRPRLARPPSAFLARIEAEALASAARLAETRAELIRTGAAEMVKQPWRITKAVYGTHVAAFWPVDGKTAADVLADCAARLAGAEKRRREGHWTYDASLHIALEQAEAALLAIVLAPREGA